MSDSALLVAAVILVFAAIGVIALIAAAIMLVMELIDRRRREPVHELSQDEIEEHLRPWAPSVRNGKVRLP